MPPKWYMCPKIVQFTEMPLVHEAKVIVRLPLLGTDSISPDVDLSENMAPLKSFSQGMATLLGIRLQYLFLLAPSDDLT